jgi:putative ABC transport system ATP-binding protein
MSYSIQHITKNFTLHDHIIPVLNDINLTINQGDTVSIRGRSGSGKSTLLNILSTLDKPTSGELNFEGKMLGTLSDSLLTDFRGKTLGFVFQQFNLIPYLSVRENVGLPLLLQNKSKIETEILVSDALAAVELSDRANFSPSHLSGGQMQRVAIARAIVTKPQILFADEPTGNLDKTTSQEIVQLLFELNQKFGTTLVLVTHDEELANMAKKNC